MRSALRAAGSAFAALLLSVPMVAAQDSTNKAPQETHTLFGSIFHGAHFAAGAVSVPYVGGRKALTESRYAFTPSRWPAWTIAYVGGRLYTGDTTAYAGSTPAMGTSITRPRLGERFFGVELQRRWNRTQVVHPIATIATGTVHNYFYYYEHPAAGGSVYHRDRDEATRYVQLAGGGELNIVRWLRAALVIGYRGASAYALPTGSTSRSGGTTSFVLEFGKF
jgi:hypothetical protein